MAGVLLSAAALITAGSLALTLYGHSASAVGPRGHRQRPASGDDPVARDQAAAWVAGQIGRTTIVSADPAMCRVLESQGFPARNLYELGPEATNPIRSTVIVATPAVRAQFGTLLSSVYAPAVLASFGSGRQRVDIREIAPHGAAAYHSMLAADLAARKSTAAELLRSNRINVSPTARRQLSAGQVDSRLEITVAAMAAKHPIYIVAFNGFAPGADANMPLRFADLIQASSGHLVGSRSVAPAFVRSMVAFLRGQAPFQPLRVETVHLAGTTLCCASNSLRQARSVCSAHPRSWGGGGRTCDTPGVPAGEALNLGRAQPDGHALGPHINVRVVAGSGRQLAGGGELGQPCGERAGQEAGRRIPTAPQHPPVSDAGGGFTRRELGIGTAATVGPVADHLLPESTEVRIFLAGWQNRRLATRLRSGPPTLSQVSTAHSIAGFLCTCL